jgi:predicted CoA-substrate-specific enzyme activase
MICAGIDAGSRAIKIVLIDAETSEIMATGIADQGIDGERLSSELFYGILRDNGYSREDVARTVATGYARNMIGIADAAITEITCHARGVHKLVPEARTIIEIGGQDSKLLRLDESGSLYDFAMNDRCAAGTGRFLEVVAARFELDIRKLGEMASKSEFPAPISSMCVVFAETEIIGLLATGASPNDIIAGVQHSVASRVVAMAGRKFEQPVVFTGGVAMVEGMDSALATALKCPVQIAPNPQMTGALGAALTAASQIRVG